MRQMTQAACPGWVGCRAGRWFPGLPGMGGWHAWHGRTARSARACLERAWRGAVPASPTARLSRAQEKRKGLLALSPSAWAAEPLQQCQAARIWRSDQKITAETTAPDYKKLQILMAKSTSLFLCVLRPRASRVQGQGVSAVGSPVWKRTDSVSTDQGSALKRFGKKR